MTGEGIAAIILAAGTVAGQIGTIFMQFQQRKMSKSNSDKIDENTALTKDTAAKVEVVHAATTAIQEATGTHRALSE